VINAEPGVVVIGVNKPRREERGRRVVAIKGGSKGNPNSGSRLVPATATAHE